MQIRVKEHLHTYSSCFPGSGLNFKAITNKREKKKKKKPSVEVSYNKYLWLSLKGNFVYLNRHSCFSSFQKTNLPLRSPEALQSDKQ